MLVALVWFRHLYGLQYCPFKMNTTQWKENLLAQLKARNEREYHPYRDLIIAYQKILSQVDSLRRQNTSLEYRNNQLQEEVDQSSAQSAESGATASSGDLAKDNKKIKDLEHKLADKERKVMEITTELTDSVKKNRDAMEKINELTKEAHASEDKCKAANSQVIEVQSNMDLLKAQNRSLQDSVKEVEQKYQLLKNEHDTLQITCTSIEQKLRQSQKEGDQMEKTIMEMKTKQVDEINLKHEAVIKERAKQLEKEIHEASQAKVTQVSRSQKGKRTSTSDDLAPDFANDVKLPSICPAVNVYSLDAHDGEMSACNFSSRGTYFATGGSDKLVKLWSVDTTTGKCAAKNTLIGSNASIMSIVFDDLEKYVLAASNDYSARLWSVAEYKARQTLTGHGNKVLCAKFLDESKVVTGSHDRTLKLWDLRYKTCSKTLFAGSSCNDVVAGKGMGRMIISGHFDKTIKFWDIQSGSANVITLAGRITSLDLSPDERLLLCCSRDDTLRLIDLRQNSISATFTADGFKVNVDWSRACFSPDGQYVAAGSSDGTLFVWETITGSHKNLKQHSHPVVACAWHPNGQVVASVERHKKMIIWKR
ncbi:autophagy-related protein 16-like isoform X2 [Dysidea avara]|uniref:autophagy-related protein 16-like isoform X2 n=1 Tax=Dysidea avara TaxID=196820 RepID=UPI00332C8645